MEGAGEHVSGVGGGESGLGQEGVPQRGIWPVTHRKWESLGSFRFVSLTPCGIVLRRLSVLLGQ